MQFLLDGFRIKFRILTLLLAASGALAPFGAEAGGRSQLFELVMRPVGRYLITRTHQGEQIARHVVGRPVRNTRDYFEFTAELEKVESMWTRREFESRLARIEADFMAEMAAHPRFKASQVLRRYARTRLRSRIATSREFHAEGRLLFRQLPRSYYARTRSAFVEAGDSWLPAERLLEAHRAGEGLAGARIRWVDLTRLRAGRRPLSLNGIDLQFADAIGLRADGVHFYEAFFNYASLNQADFRGARLIGARFINADLRLANFKGADLSGARLDGARLENALFDSSTRLPFSRQEALRRGMVERSPFRMHD